MAAVGGHIVDAIADISVGLEFKFLLLRTASPPSLTELCAVGDRDVVLPQIQRHAYAEVATTIERVSGQRAVTIHEIQDDNRQEPEFWQTHWIVKKANSAEPKTKDELRHPTGSLVPVELSSPRLRWVDTNAQVPAHEVLRSLKRVHHIAVNFTCDVHIHIGRMDGAAFSLLALKKLATILWLAEPTLRSIRDPKSPNFTNTFTWGAELRHYSRLADSLANPNELLRLVSGNSVDNRDELCKHLGVPKTSSFPDAIRTIWRVSSTRELGRLLSGPEKQYRRLGFNFSAFGAEDERAARAPKTVEFRILEGTLQDELIFGWLHICCRVVELASAERSAAFRDTVRHLLFGSQGQGDPATAFGELMERVGVDAAIYTPFQVKIRQDRGLPVPGSGTDVETAA